MAGTLLSRAGQISAGKVGRTLYNKNRTTVRFLISKEQQHDR
jgi:hypothetical protein